MHWSAGTASTCLPFTEREGRRKRAGEGGGSSKEGGEEREKDFQYTVKGLLNLVRSVFHITVLTMYAYILHND